VVRAGKLKQVADDFDHIHDIRRGLQVGSVDRIIQAADLGPFTGGSFNGRHGS
jgi:hypothetical protein